MKMYDLRKEALANKKYGGISIMLLIVTICLILTLGFSDGFAASAETIADALIGNVQYEGDFNAASDEYIEQTYGGILKDAEYYMVFVDQSGQHADELAIFDTKKNDAVFTTYEAIKTHLAERRAAMPAEADKIDHAVAWVYQNYVVVCVTDDYENAALELRRFSGYQETNPEALADSDSAAA